MQSVLEEAKHDEASEDDEPNEPIIELHEQPPKVEKDEREDASK